MDPEREVIDLRNDAGSREHDLANVFVALAKSLVSGLDVVDLMEELTAGCVNLLGCDEAGIVLIDAAGDLQVMASSSERMRLLELYEVQKSEGPCFDSFTNGVAVHALELAGSGERWPHFTPAARSVGVTSAIALPLRLRDQTIGALNLFFTGKQVVSAGDLALAQALADVATVGVIQQRAAVQRDLVVNQLQRALDSRLTIEQAKGVIAERGGLSMDNAFAQLRAYSRHNRRQISQVAAALVAGEVSPANIIRFNVGRNHPTSPSS